VLFVWIRRNQFTFHLLVSMWHRRFLPRKHKYSQWRTRFDGTIENEEAPKYRDGKFVFEMINNINVVFGKPVKGKKRKKNEKAPVDPPFKNNQFSSGTYPIGKSSRLVMPSISRMIQRVSLKVPSVYC
jgi:hypothetical protein